MMHDNIACLKRAISRSVTGRLHSALVGISTIIASSALLSCGSNVVEVFPKGTGELWYVDLTPNLLNVAVGDSVLYNVRAMDLDSNAILAKASSADVISNDPSSIAVRNGYLVATKVTPQPVMVIAQVTVGKRTVSDTTRVGVHTQPSRASSLRIEVPPGDSARRSIKTSGSVRVVFRASDNTELPGYAYRLYASSSQFCDCFLYQTPFFTRYKQGRLWLFVESNIQGRELKDSLEYTFLDLDQLTLMFQYDTLTYKLSDNSYPKPGFQVEHFYFQPKASVRFINFVPRSGSLAVKLTTPSGVVTDTVLGPSTLWSIPLSETGDYRWSAKYDRGSLSGRWTVRRQDW